MEILAAGFWGFVSGAALLVGAMLGFYIGASQRVIAATMALGVGVLISSVAFELTDESYRQGGLDATAIGLLTGALAFFAADWAVNRAGGRHRKRSGRDRDDGFSKAIALGALMDGIPESAVIGISLVGGGPVSWAFVVAVFLSNVPESLSATAGMKNAGHSARYVFGLWGAVVVASLVSAVLSYLFLAKAPADIVAGIQAFAAGAILVMLASTMMPEAYEEGGEWVGVVTAVGFLLAFVLSHLE